MPRRLDARQSGFDAAFAELLDAKRGIEEAADAASGAIVEDVRRNGDAALLRLTERFDRVRATPASLRVSDREFDDAIAACKPGDVAALEFAATRIADYHRRMMPTDLDYTDAAGLRLGARWRALDAVGLYVPGGLAAYPSSVLMTAVPARVAGVGRVAMAVPAPDGRLNPLVLAAARVAGVGEVWRIGGAQAIAALAYGTESIRAVDKIVGPGNAYVAAAKRRVFGQVGIDLIAGPSEILVVADGANDPAWIAADLVSQAEHDEAAQAILVTDDAQFAEAVARAVEDVLAVVPRAAVARASWRDYGAIVIVANLADAPALVDRLAPEHVELAVADPVAMAARIRHAGAIFLGRHAPEAVGDYVAGPSHVLPTSRSARFSSGLGVLDFMKRTSIIGLDAAALARVGPAAAVLAEAEGLHAHARSISVRLEGAIRPKGGA